MLAGVSAVTADVSFDVYLNVTTQSFSKGCKMSPLNIYKGDFALNQ